MFMGPLLIIGVALLAVWLYQQQTQQRARTGPAINETGDRALAMLRERYAKGEISSEEFNDVRRRLR